MKHQVGDRVWYVSGWDGEDVFCEVIKAMTPEEVHPLERKQNPCAPAFYEVLADDGHSTVLPEALVNPVFIVSEERTDDGFEIKDQRGTVICTAMLCEDHQIRPSIAATIEIPEANVRYVFEG